MRNQVEEGICFHGELIFNPIDAERQPESRRVQRRRRGIFVESHPP
jgi:hypothetical protein